MNLVKKIIIILLIIGIAVTSSVVTIGINYGFNQKNANYFYQNKLLALLENKNFKIINEKTVRVFDAENSNEDIIYIFSSDVAYINDSGKFVLKNNRIISHDKNYYSSISNNINAFIPKNTKNNFMLSKNQNNIYIDLPNGRESSEINRNFKNIHGQINDSIQFKNIYSDRDELSIYFTNSGIESELCLNDEIDKYNYSIIINNSYISVENDEYILFKDIHTNENVFILYAPYIHDKSSDSLYKLPQYVYEQKNGNYNIEISLDGINFDFSVIINQTYNMYNFNSEDTKIKNNDYNQYFLSNYNDLSFGKSEGLVRCVNLGVVENEKISSVKYLFNTLNKNNKKFYIKISPVLSDWCSMTVDWRSKPLYDRNNSIIANVSERGEVLVDISELAALVFEKNILLNGFNISNLSEDELFMSTSDNAMFLNAFVVEVERK